MGRADGARTTARDSLPRRAEAAKALRCERTAGRAATHNRLAAEPKIYGVIFEAIGAVRGRNGWGYGGGLEIFEVRSTSDV